MTKRGVTEFIYVGSIQSSTGRGNAEAQRWSQRIGRQHKLSLPRYDSTNSVSRPRLSRGFCWKTSMSKCCSTATVQIEMLWTHHWCTDQPTNSLTIGYIWRVTKYCIVLYRLSLITLPFWRIDIARHSAALSGVAAYPRRWYANSTETQISHDWSAYRAIFPSVSTGFSSRSYRKPDTAATTVTRMFQIS